MPEDETERAFAVEDATFAEGEDAIYTPAITLWAFLSQVLHKDEQRSCLAAVARVITLLVVLGKKPCGEDSGAYYRARAKLHEPVLARLALETADRCESQLPEQCLWHGRHVKLVDGTNCIKKDGWRNSIYASLSVRWAWTFCAASHQRWFARKFGHAYWPTT